MKGLAGILAIALTAGIASAETAFFDALRAASEQGRPVYVLRPAGCPAEAHEVVGATATRADLSFVVRGLGDPLLTTLFAEGGTVLSSSAGALITDFSLRYRVDEAGPDTMVMTLLEVCTGTAPPLYCQPAGSNIHTLRFSFADPCTDGVA